MCQATMQIKKMLAERQCLAGADRDCSFQPFNSGCRRVFLNLSNHAGIKSFSPLRNGDTGQAFSLNRLDNSLKVEKKRGQAFLHG
jgi:hypothetical protein